MLFLLGIVLFLVMQWELLRMFLKIKKFAQPIFGRAVRDHIVNYCMYYGLAIMFFIVALTG